MFIMHETGLNWKALPQKTFASHRELAALGLKINKDRITALASATGSHQLPMFVIGKSLLRDDCLHETEDVTEALRRIPQQVVDERNFRIVRAMQLSLTKTILPEKEWTKYEEDKLYLSPVVEQVRKERQEREEWEKNY